MNEEQEFEVMPTYGFNDGGDLDLHRSTGFCPFSGCPCHEDRGALIQGVDEHYQNGLLTPAEATRIVQGWPV